MKSYKSPRLSTVAVDVSPISTEKESVYSNFENAESSGVMLEKAPVSYRKLMKMRL